MVCRAGRTGGLAAALLVAWSVAGPALAYGQATARGGVSWLDKGPAAQYQPRRSADAPFSVEVPRKEWLVLPASRSALMVLAARKGDADVLVERTALQFALAPEDITDVLATVQVEAAKTRDPKATDFDARVLDAGTRRLVAIQYTRPGVLGQERVRQYTIPAGQWLYHITTVAQASQFAAYERIFAHIAASFTAIE